jgi:hypothetical protein
MKEVLEFDLDCQEQPVKIAGEDYVLVELNGKQRDKWLTNIGNRRKTDKKGNPIGGFNFDGMQAALVTECLFKVAADGTRTGVPIETIQRWPAKVSGGLFDAARGLSGLDEDDEQDDSGND